MLILKICNLRPCWVLPNGDIYMVRYTGPFYMFSEGFCRSYYRCSSYRISRIFAGIDVDHLSRCGDTGHHRVVRFRIRQSHLNNCATHINIA